MTYKDPSKLRCQSCGGRLKPSNLETDLYICRKCNEVTEAWEVEK